MLGELALNSDEFTELAIQASSDIDLARRIRSHVSDLPSLQSADAEEKGGKGLESGQLLLGLLKIPKMPWFKTNKTRRQ